jgi:hypothetical protein
MRKIDSVIRLLKGVCEAQCEVTPATLYIIRMLILSENCSYSTKRSSRHGAMTNHFRPFSRNTPTVRDLSGIETSPSSS